VGTVLLGDVRRKSPWLTTIGTPVIAAFAMTAWDLALDPTSSTVNHAWIWENGGGFFGVPLVNFLGWTFTVYLFMQVFAIYLRARGPLSAATTAGDLQGTLLYAATTFSFFTKFATGTRTTVTDAVGATWRTGDIYETSVLLTVYGMLFISILALLRIAQRHTQTGALGQHTGEPAGDELVRLGDDPPDKLGDGRDVPDDALHHAGGPDADVEVTDLEDLPATSPRHQVPHVLEPTTVVQDRDDLGAHRVARHP
jgi:hypothetical protein